MTRKEFKKRWESNKNGGGITLNDIANCAIACGICSSPRTMRTETVLYLVLAAANTNDCEEYDPETGEFR